MRTALFFITVGMLTFVLSNKGIGQRFSRLNSTVALAAMNNHTQTSEVFQSVSDRSAVTYYNPYSTNIHDIVAYLPPAYTTSVGVSYQVPGIVFFDWLQFHLGALSALNDGPGAPNTPNYLDSDVPTLLALAYNDYVNPSAYGSRNLVITVQQYWGKLNWYSSTAGGGEFVKNRLLWFSAIKGTLHLKIQ
jgi:hypothetical protein